MGVEYAVVAMATDYDCWKETESPVTWEEIEKVMTQNAENVKKLLIHTIQKISKHSQIKLESDIIKSKIRTIPNFPKQGVMFRDITTLFQDREGMKKIMEMFYNQYKDKKIDVVAGIEARGFIVGGGLAEKLGVGFVPIRKKGKLPHDTIQYDYDLEYGKSTIEIHKDAIKPGQRVLVIDDLIATSGTAGAACELIKKLGGTIIDCAFIIELEDLGGRKKLEDKGLSVFSIVQFNESE
jgi:adenine phosphoribosyltransferase